MAQLLKEQWIKLNMKLIKAKASFVRFSPRKLKLIADAVRKMNPVEAISYLKFFPHKAAVPVLKVFKQAMGNAKDVSISPADLAVRTLQIQGGPRGAKKADVHSHGARFDRGVRRKRLSHIILELSTNK